MINHFKMEPMTEKEFLVELAKGIDWDQQNCSCYYIEEDMAVEILIRLGKYPWEEGINNETVDKFVTGYLPVEGK